MRATPATLTTEQAAARRKACGGPCCCSRSWPWRSMPASSCMGGAVAMSDPAPSKPSARRVRAAEDGRRGAGRVHLHLRDGAAVPHRLREGVRRAPGKRRRQAPATRPAATTTRWVTVQFDGGVNSKLPWAFRPEQLTMRVHPGQQYEAKLFRAEQQRPRASSATRCPRSRRRARRVISARPSASASPRRRWPRASRATCRCASSSTRTCRATSARSRLSYTFYKNDALTARLPRGDDRTAQSAAGTTLTPRSAP